MNRTIIAVSSVLGLATLVWANNAASQAKFHSKQLDLTGFAEGGLSYDRPSGVFHAKGNPVLHAMLPQKHLSLDAANLDGHFDDNAGVLKDATLTGGVHGILDNKAKKGTNRITFSSPTAIYTDKGTPADPGADIEASGGVNFQSSNVSVGSKFALNGSHGVFHLRTPTDQQMSLQGADIDGPVTFNFSGVQIGTDKKAEPSSGSGKADHLKLSRSGSDYVLHLIGNVSLKGMGGGIDVDFPGTQGVVVTMDEAGNFKSFDSDSSISGTLTPSKKS